MRTIALATVVAHLAAPLLADEQPTVRETVEIREVGVIADLDAGLRGLGARELGERLIVLEDGAARTPTSVTALAAAGRPTYARVVVAFDTEKCDEAIARAGAAAVGSEAERLVALGPVEVVRAGERSETLVAGATSGEPIARAAAALARSASCPPPVAGGPVVPRGLDPGRCASAPCLLVWVGGGFATDAATLEAAAPVLEARAAALASGGWVVLSAPISAPERPGAGPTVRPPQQQPGSDRITFGVSVFSKRKEKLTAEEYERAVDLWLAPLRRLARATCGEVAATGEELAAALDALGRRSMVWYRAERTPGAPPPRLELRAAGGAANRLAAPEWAPELAR